MRAAIVKVDVIGTAGSARTISPINGVLMAVHIDYGDQPETCVVSITQDDPALALLSVTGNTGDWFYPRVEAATDHFEPYPVVGYVEIAVTGGSAGPLVVSLVYAE